MAKVITGELAIYREAKEEVNNKPFDPYERLKTQHIDTGWGLFSTCDLKENERYSVLLGEYPISYQQWSRDTCDITIGVQLQSFRTGELVTIDLAELFRKKYYRRNREIMDSGEINILLVKKYESSKPYITQKEIIDYFRAITMNRFIYFTFKDHRPTLINIDCHFGI